MQIFAIGKDIEEAMLEIESEIEELEKVQNLSMGYQPLNFFRASLIFRDVGRFFPCRHSYSQLPSRLEIRRPP